MTELLDVKILVLNATETFCIILLLHSSTASRHCSTVHDPAFLAFRGDNHFLSEAVFLGGIQKYTRKVAITICYGDAGVTEG